MNKTIVACFSIVTAGMSLVFGMYLYSSHILKIKNISQAQTKTETRDRLTVCIDTVMTKSIEAKQPINAKDAREICG